MATTQNREKLQRLQSYLMQDPKNINILGEIAFLHYTSGNFESARQSAQHYLSLDDKSPLPHTLLGLIAADQLDNQTACKHFSESHILGENDPYIYFKYAQALSLLGQHSEAEPLLQEAIKDPQRAPHAEILLVRVLHYLGRLDDAIALGEQAISAGRSSPQLYSFMATLYIDNDDLIKAEESSQKALEADPGNPEALTVHSLLQLNNLQTDTAHGGFRSAIAAQPSNGRAHLGQGLAYMLDGDMSQAVSSIEHATQAMPSHIGTWHALAWCHLMQKNTDAAEQAFNKAYELDRNFGETHGGLAIIALMKGQTEAAKKYALQAKKLGGGLSAQYAQVLVQQTVGHGEQAKKMMEELMSGALLPDGQSIQQAVAKYLARR